MKRNYKMTVRYDGTRYFGWERQPGKELTIQGKLESVLNKMTDAPEDQPVNVIILISSIHILSSLHKTEKDRSLSISRK